MADLKTTNMKDENIGGWKSQVLALYQSLVIFIFGSISFILRLMQEYFKNGEINMEEKPKSTNDIGGKTKLRYAGEHQVEEGIKEPEQVTSPSEHTVVELPSTQAAPAVAAASEDKAVFVEPSGDQSKNTLVIKNLPFKFKPVDLEKLLSDNHTKPKNVRLLRDESGRFSGMAFIRCPSKDEAQRLISSMNGMDIGGRTIQVEFKLKKKKGSGSCDSLSSSSCSSSSDELPGCRLRISSENVELKKLINETLITQPASASTRGKLSGSAEHLTLSEAPHSQALKKAMFQPRRKSTSSTGEIHHYINSAMPKLSLEANRGSGIRPVRQPMGPDGTNGFSTEYRRSRKQHV